MPYAWARASQNVPVGLGHLLLNIELPRRFRDPRISRTGRDARLLQSGLAVKPALLRRPDIALKLRRVQKPAREQGFVRRLGVRLIYTVQKPRPIVAAGFRAVVLQVRHCQRTGAQPQKSQKWKNQ